MRLLSSYIDRSIIGLYSWAASKKTVVVHCRLSNVTAGGSGSKDAYPGRDGPCLGQLARSRRLVNKQQNSKTQKSNGIAVAKNDCTV